MRGRGPQCRQRIVALERGRARLLAELLAVRIDDDGHVQVLRCRHAEAVLQVDLASGRVEQVSAAHDVRDVRIGIVDDDRELVGPLAVRALQHEIADFGREVL